MGAKMNIDPISIDPTSIDPTTIDRMRIEYTGGQRDDVPDVWVFPRLTSQGRITSP
jgi:hypothetical protein